MRRGEIWWANLAGPAARRPVLLLSRNEAYAIRELVTVAPLTTRVRGIPTEVPLDQSDGVPKPCAINLDTVTTIPKSLLAVRLSDLSRIRMASVDRALRYALGLV